MAALKLTESELYERMRVYTPSMPFDVARNIVVNEALRAAGFRLLTSPLFGQELAKIAPPYEIAWTPSLLEWEIKQGD